MKKQTVQKQPVSLERKQRESREMLLSILFIAPALIGFFIFFFLPLLNTFGKSLTDWTGYSTQWNFIGTENYITVLSQPRFYRSIGRSCIFTVFHMVVGAGGGLLIAFMIAEARWFQNLFRVLFFFPRMLSLSVVGIVWVQLCHPKIGLFNSVLKAIGLEELATAWLGQGKTAMVMVSLASAWNAFGFYMVIFLASMQVIDPTLYESARLDGASRWQQFVYVTIPCMKNTISMVLVMSFISGLKGFGTVWAMTEGGPLESTELAMVYIWRNAFQNGQMAPALAASIIFGGAILIVSVVLNQIRERGEE